MLLFEISKVMHFWKIPILRLHNQPSALNSNPGIFIEFKNSVNHFYIFFTKNLNKNIFSSMLDKLRWLDAQYIFAIILKPLNLDKLADPKDSYLNWTKLLSSWLLSWARGTSVKLDRGSRKRNCSDLSTLDWRSKKVGLAQWSLTVVVEISVGWRSSTVIGGALWNIAEFDDILIATDDSLIIIFISHGWFIICHLSSIKFHSSYDHHPRRQWITPPTLRLI